MPSQASVREKGAHVPIMGGGTAGAGGSGGVNLRIELGVERCCPFQAEMATKLGMPFASRSETLPWKSPRQRRWPMGKPVYAGGFDWVYDCVGSRREVDESMRVVGPDAGRNTTAAWVRPSRLDPSFVCRESSCTSPEAMDIRQKEGQPSYLSLFSGCSASALLLVG